MPRRPGTALASVAVALALAGCASGATSPSDEEPAGLAAFFEQLGDSSSGEAGERKQRRIEELVAACMAEQGFEYTPADPSAMLGADEDMPEYNTKEYADQYGYGLTTIDPPTADEYADPNADYVASMSESEQAAYYEALNGTMPEPDPEDPDAEWEYDWEQAGCYGAASHEVSGTELFGNPEFDDFFADMQQEGERINAEDEGLREALEKWRTCMADAGYDFQRPDEPQSSISDESMALWESMASADPEATDAPAEPDEAAMAALREKELKLARTDWGCRESSRYEEANQAAWRDAEERLWEKWGAQLEPLLEQTPAE